MNQSYTLHDRTAELIVEGLTVLMAYEKGEYEPHPPTDEWIEDIKAARGTILAQNADLRE